MVLVLILDSSWLLGQYQLSEAPSFERRDESLTASDIDQVKSQAFEWCKEVLMGSDILHSRRRSRVATVLGKAFVQFPRLITWCSFSLGLIRGNVLHLQIHYNISNDKSIKFSKLLSICKFPCSHFYLFLHPQVNVLTGVCFVLCYLR